MSDLHRLWKDSDDLLWSDDSNDIDFVAVKSLLDSTYFHGGRSMHDLIRQAAHSMCFSLFQRKADEPGMIDQVGFARVVTDYVQFGWVADVVIEGRYRRRGWGRKFMEVIMAHPKLKGVTLNLGTRSPAFYAQLGFEKCEQMMRRASP